MISFLSDYFGRNRSIAWQTIGGLIALAAVVFAVGSQAPWFSLGWYPESTMTADRSALTKAAATDLASGHPDRDVRLNGSGSVIGASKTSGTKLGTAAGAMTGHSASEKASPANDPDTNNDDAALFAALERMERRMAAAINKARESVVAFEYTAPDTPPGTRRIATGVVINHRGEALSVRIDQPPAAQASMGGKSSSVIVARDFSGRCHSVHWLASDPETGLTLLRLPPRAVRPIRTASGGPILGSQVFVVGNPFGMGHSVSRGHVAGLDRALELGTRQLGGLIQVQAPVYPGDSGAAVVNLQGDWLGLIRSGLAIPGSGSAAGSEAGPNTPVPGSDSPSGLSPVLARADIALGRPEHDTDFGFAIPVQDALWVAEQLRSRGRVDRAYLGVRLGPSSSAAAMAVNESVRPVEPTSIASSEASPENPSSIPANADGSPASANEGAILREVLSGTPAAQAGLRPGDGILELDGQPIRSAHDLTDRLDRIPAQANILLGVVRDRGPGRQRLSVSLRTASRPRAPQVAGPGSPPLAMATASMGPAASSPLLSVSPGPGGIRVSSPVNPETALPPPQASELRFTLPRAIVERLEKLELRLEKLESFPTGATGSAPASDRQISSARNP